ncbi:MAG TPA: lipopolysaccharide assembly protein LapA domain-containing protein [Deferrisomatales bacterium]|nr:lipopolysaccharide assembly protein LapA domain-containing protein [Deferrisomatales bacterium]
MLSLLKKVVFAVAVLLLVLLGYQNAEILSTKTHFVFDLYAEGYQWQTPEFPVVLLYGVFFLLGLLAAGFHGIYERIARKTEIRRRNKRIRRLEAETDTLRSQLAELRPPPAAEPAAGELPRIEAPAIRDDEPTL